MTDEHLDELTRKSANREVFGITPDEMDWLCKRATILSEIVKLASFQAENGGMISPTAILIWTK